MTNGYHQPVIEIRVFLLLDRLPSNAYETHLPVALVGFLGPLGAQLPSVTTGRKLHRTCYGEAMYWHRETDALGSPFRISANQRR